MTLNVKPATGAKRAIDGAEQSEILNALGIPDLLLAKADTDTMNVELSLRVKVGPDGSLTADDQVVQAAYLGVKTAAQITDIHTGIASGSLTYPTGSVLITEDGVVMTLQGVGTTARFVANTSSEGTPVQPIKTGPYTVVPADNKSIVPVSGAATITVPTGLGKIVAQFLRYDVAELKLQAAGSGVKLYRNGVRITSIAVTGHLNWLAILPADATDEFYVIGNGNFTVVNF